MRDNFGHQSSPLTGLPHKTPRQSAWRALYSASISSDHHNRDLKGRAPRAIVREFSRSWMTVNAIRRYYCTAVVVWVRARSPVPIFSRHKRARTLAVLCTRMALYLSPRQLVRSPPLARCRRAGLVRRRCPNCHKNDQSDGAGRLPR